jgi:hypothetical protein
LDGDRDLTAPDPNEIEVSLFGPGYGEAVVVHLGRNDWLIVDSCLNESRRWPAPLDYLSTIGVDPASAVRVIVATHWHDDHVRGIAEVLRVCRDARFVCSMALRCEEFKVLAGLSGRDEDLVSGVREMFEVQEELRGRAAVTGRASASPTWALSSRVVWSRTGNPSGTAPAVITSFAPSDHSVTRAIQAFSSLIPQPESMKRRVVGPSPNHASVVLWVEVAGTAVLLGADLENTTDPGTGWAAVLADHTLPNGKATAFKIPHHGSANADSPQVWIDRLVENPHAILSPWESGRHYLPMPEDRRRICGRTPNAFITRLPPSAATKVRRSSTVEKTIRQATLSIREVRHAVGQIRLRKRAGENGWRVATFGTAVPLVV